MYDEQICKLVNEIQQVYAEYQIFYNKFASLPQDDTENAQEWRQTAFTTGALVMTFFWAIRRGLSDLSNEENQQKIIIYEKSSINNSKQDQLRKTKQEKTQRLDLDKQKQSNLGNFSDREKRIQELPASDAYSPKQLEQCLKGAWALFLGAFNQLSTVSKQHKLIGKAVLFYLPELEKPKIGLPIRLPEDKYQHYFYIHERKLLAALRESDLPINRPILKGLLKIIIWRELAGLVNKEASELEAYLIQNNCSEYWAKLAAQYNNSFYFQRFFELYFNSSKYWHIHSKEEKNHARKSGLFLPHRTPKAAYSGLKELEITLKAYRPPLDYSDEAATCEDFYAVHQMRYTNLLTPTILTKPLDTAICMVYMILRIYVQKVPKSITGRPSEASNTLKIKKILTSLDIFNELLNALDKAGVNSVEDLDFLINKQSKFQNKVIEAAKKLSERFITEQEFKTDYEAFAETEVMLNNDEGLHAYLTENYRLKLNWKSYPPYKSNFKSALSKYPWAQLACLINQVSYANSTTEVLSNPGSCSDDWLTIIQQVYEHFPEQSR